MVVQGVEALLVAGRADPVEEGVGMVNGGEGRVGRREGRRWGG